MAGDGNPPSGKPGLEEQVHRMHRNLCGDVIGRAGEVAEGNDANHRLYEGDGNGRPSADPCAVAVLVGDDERGEGHRQRQGEVGDGVAEKLPVSGGLIVRSAGQQRLADACDDECGELQDRED